MVRPEHETWRAVMASVCKRCGEPIEWRVSKNGRKYPVNGPGTTGAVGQFHSTHCPARRFKLGSEAIPARSLTEALDRSIEQARELHRQTHNRTLTMEAPEVKPDTRSDLAAVIASHVAALIPTPTAAVDESTVRSIVADEMAKIDLTARAVVVSVKGSDAPAIDVGRQHESFPVLLQIMGRRRNVWMVGPAGSGKTTAAHAAATALGLQFGSISVGPQTTQSALFGYMDAHGNYVSTEFRRRYAEGGVFLFDEIDRGNPGVLTALNQAIENGSCAFPDAMVPRHADFIAVAAANTYGTGASREYVGALQIDAATLDRFVMLAWSYDEGLETDLTLATFTAAGGNGTTVPCNWLDRVRKARAQAVKLSIRHIVSPRASIIGAELLAIGMDEDAVAALVLWKGADADTIARLS